MSGPRSKAKKKAETLPVAPAVRRPPRTFTDPPTWRVRCPYCQHAHLHAADPVLTELVLPSRCGGGTKFYIVREVER